MESKCSLLCLASLTLQTLLRVLHVVVCIGSSLSLLNCIPLYRGTTIYLSIHQLMDYLHCFHFVSNTNRTAIYICVQVFVWTYVFISFGSILGSLLFWSTSSMTPHCLDSSYPLSATCLLNVRVLLGLSSTRCTSHCAYRPCAISSPAVALFTHWHGAHFQN